MSVVTNVILVYSVTGDEDDQFKPLEAINAACNAGRLVHVEDPALPPDWFCNGKTLECNVAVGAYNYLRLSDWLAAMRDIDFDQWGCEFVQVLVMEQDDERFRLIDVWPQPERRKSAGPPLEGVTRDGHVVRWYADESPPEDLV